MEILETIREITLGIVSIGATLLSVAVLGGSLVLLFDTIRTALARRSVNLTNIFISVFFLAISPMMVKMYPPAMLAAVRESIENSEVEILAIQDLMVDTSDRAIDNALNRLTPEPTPTPTMFPTVPFATNTPTITPTPASTATPVAQVTYTVERGDTLAKIARRFNVTVDDLARANSIQDVNRIDVNQVLIIP